MALRYELRWLTWESMPLYWAGGRYKSVAIEKPNRIWKLYWESNKEKDNPPKNPTELIRDPDQLIKNWQYQNGKVVFVGAYQWEGWALFVYEDEMSIDCDTDGDSSKPCDHPSCDATYGHADAEDSACPWHSGSCWYCGYSDCMKSHPKCDGSTYKERNSFP